VGQPAPKPGSDAYEILGEIGLSEREIEVLINNGVVRVEGVTAG
jgi:crotonobetainyl-CoA:carnitine CoA-transferase CaiB-like acyl-CoA transferase